MNVARNGRIVKLPDFLIVGAARSGTTTLFSLLSRHPRVFLPPEKEPMFLSVRGQGAIPVDVRTGKPAAYVIGDLDRYLDLFKSAREEDAVGEASTWYLYRHRSTIRNIQELYGEKAGEVRILILLRDPAARAWSHYQLKRRNGEESLPFERAIDPGVIRERLQKNFTPGFDYVGFGRYFEPVRSYLENFPRVHILWFEDLMNDAAGAAREVCAFLGLEPGPARGGAPKLNVSGAPRNRLTGVMGNFLYRPGGLKPLLKPFLPYRLRADLKSRLSSRLFRPERLEAGLRDRLIDIFRDDILALAGLTGRDLSRWLEPAGRTGT